MTSFKDRTGQRWDVEIDILVARAIQARTSLNVYSLLTKEQLERVAADVILSTDLIWAAVEPQANERKVDEQTFWRDRMDSDTLQRALDCVYDASVEALPEQKKIAARKLLATLRAIGEKTQHKAIETIAAMDVDALVTNAQTHLDMMAKQALTTGNR